MMPIPVTRIGVKDHYDARPKAVQEYFEHIPGLLASFPLNICIAYSFSQVELAHNMTLYCGVMKKHKAERTIARAVIDAHHMTRAEFQERFEVVFSAPLTNAVLDPLIAAEDVRDKIMHGKRILEREKREALYNVLTYAELFNDELQAVAGFRPFGNLKGFKGWGKSLDRATTRWVLKGMGFNAS
jgi:hypothetical protein